MSQHNARIEWKRTDPDFNHDTYSRAHHHHYEKGQSLKGTGPSSTPGDPNGVDPEELLISAIMSCHMLTFLAISAKKRLTVDHYEDNGSAYINKMENGKFSVTEAIIRPKAVFSGDNIPDQETILKIHDKAHQHCVIANSLKTVVKIEPVT